MKVKIYAVFTEKIEITPVYDGSGKPIGMAPEESEAKLDGVYTTKNGAENRVRRLCKSGYFNSYILIKSLKGDLLKLAEEYMGTLAKKKGKNLTKLLRGMANDRKER